jgi:hypothetical protein
MCSIARLVRAIEDDGRWAVANDGSGMRVDGQCIFPVEFKVVTIAVGALQSRWLPRDYGSQDSRDRMPFGSVSGHTHHWRDVQWYGESYDVPCLFEHPDHRRDDDLTRSRAMGRCIQKAPSPFPPVHLQGRGILLRVFRGHQGVESLVAGRVERFIQASPHKRKPISEFCCCCPVFTSP